MPRHAALLAALWLAACGAESRPPDVVLISIDTLRADALSSYGNSRATSPNLDALAAGGVRFERAYAQAPNTATSHASLFTGLIPWAHRVANISSLEHGTPALHPAFTTLAEHFAAGGYQTAAVTDDGPLGQAWDLLQGFELIDARYTPIEETVASALDVLENRDPDRPLFLFVHTYEVHEPYLPPPELAAAFTGDYDGPLVEALADLRREHASADAQPNARAMMRGSDSFGPEDARFLHDLYEAGVAHADAQLAALIDALPEDALVAVTSDHGEEFAEHGVYGHKQLHDETLHVPLILRLPGGELAGTVVTDQVSQIDLHGTLLAATGLRPSPGANSADLVGLARGEGSVSRQSIASTNEHLHPLTADLPLLRSIRDGEVTWIDQRAAGSELRGTLFDARDRAESTPLFEGSPSSGAPPEAERARRLLDRRFDDAGRYFETTLRNAPLAPTTRDASGAVEALRRLGYLDEE